MAAPTRSSSRKPEQNIDFCASRDSYCFRMRNNHLHLTGQVRFLAGSFRANLRIFDACAGIFSFLERVGADIDEAAQLGGKTGRLGRPGRH